MRKTLDQFIEDSKPPLEKMAQWEIEREIGLLIEDIMAKKSSAQLHEIRARKFRQEAQLATEALKRCRQRLGLPLSSIPELRTKAKARQSQTTLEDQPSSFGSPYTPREE
ncbi:MULTISPECIES: hypothetical protein [unclassified Halomonas]|uniref:hypothetical protein n=1 Tax=unclassified Halomonas TaxID=2609666 RepID=UPI0007DA2730|nr:MULTISPECIES: hypothetical protein [unclassified Halomonas]MBT2788075.1 hypothetical protein [Halomonas sp. ISL-106]MBT2795824.1 hypothetical protein [Halomonas sp. ISL-104]OAL61109.1 hypothetical protein A6R74_16050 [Halomonas sp. ALS9]